MDAESLKAALAAMPDDLRDQLWERRIFLSVDWDASRYRHYEKPDGVLPGVESAYLYAVTANFEFGDSWDDESTVYTKLLPMVIKAFDRAAADASEEKVNSGVVS